MGRKKEELSIFEQMGGTYTEKDGILYPNIFIGEEVLEPMIKCKKTPKKKCRFMAERKKKR